MAGPAPVAVVIPSHNRAEFVGRAVESVLRQTLPPHEVVVVDDASTDGTSQVLAAFGDRIRVVRSVQNIERGAARNLGVRWTSAPNLAFLDSDDEWAPSKLERQVPHCSVGIAVVTGLAVVDAAGRKLRNVVPRADPGRESLIPLNRFPGAGSSLLLTRYDFERCGRFPEQRDVQGSEDWLLLLRLCSAGVRFRGIYDHLTRVRVHATNSTGEAAAIARSMWASRALAEQEGLCAGEDARVLRACIAGVIARNFAREGNWSKVGSWLWRCGEEHLWHSLLRASASSLVTAVHHFPDRHPRLIGRLPRGHQRRAD